MDSEGKTGAADEGRRDGHAGRRKALEEEVAGETVEKARHALRPRQSTKVVWSPPRLPWALQELLSRSRQSTKAVCAHYLGGSNSTFLGSDNTLPLAVWAH